MTRLSRRRETLHKSVPVLCCDADNTLWDTDAVYRCAQLWLFAASTKRRSVKPSIEDPLAFVRSVDQDLAASHPAHLRYPPSLLISELFHKLSPQSTPPTAQLVSQLADEFNKMIRNRPKLRRGVKSGLEQLAHLRVPVHVITETSIERCQDLLHQHKIAKHIESVRSIKKDEHSFLRLRLKLSDTADAWMVGDQLTRDIIPAHAVGFRTIYFPGTFQPKWEESVTMAATTVKITTFSSVPRIVRNEGGS